MEAPEIIYERLMKISNGGDCTLLCYEAAPRCAKPGEVLDLYKLEPGLDFCHRHIVSAHLSMGGFESMEYADG